MMQRKERPARFGGGGLTSIRITAEDKLPIQARGEVTQRLYVWQVRRRTWAEWIDLRDLPSILKDLKAQGLSLDDLSGSKIDERKTQLEKRRKKREEPEEESPSPTQHGGDE